MEGKSSEKLRNAENTSGWFETDLLIRKPRPKVPLMLLELSTNLFYMYIVFHLVMVIHNLEHDYQILVNSWLFENLLLSELKTFFVNVLKEC